ncbi:MAG: DUF523 domain-containing protein [Candidatus Eiseniibacteriota bacterium]|nr:MAG: DUF523 domain-containing protein [Candidatus Eisenbacteria bacterium]
MVIVSACLAGLSCRYDGKSCPDEEVLSIVQAHQALPLCPEQLGGLPTPREPAEIQGGDGTEVLRGRAKVLDSQGKDVTSYFVKGAHEVLRLAQLAGVKEAILKAESPSCGCGRIVLRGRLVAGDGVLASLLKENGISVVTRP